jgi:hypothetical protein
VLTTNVERRLAALKSSTHVNGIQRQLFLVPDSEANASGMVSSFPTSNMRLAMLHFSWSRERIVFASVPDECFHFCFVTVWMGCISSAFNL